MSTFTNNETYPIYWDVSGRYGRSCVRATPGQPTITTVLLPRNGRMQSRLDGALNHERLSSMLWACRGNQKIELYPSEAEL